MENYEDGNANNVSLPKLRDRKVILIHNCDSAITAEEVQAIFSCMGEIIHLKKQFNPELNEFCWFLEYAHETSAKDAIEALQYYKLLGKELHIGYVDEIPSTRLEDELPVKASTNQLVIEFLEKLPHADGFPSWASVAAAHQDYVTAEVRAKIETNEKKTFEIIQRIGEFLKKNLGKIYQSWFYNDLKAIAPDSIQEILETPLADATKLEESIANKNYIYFEGISDAISLDQLRLKIHTVGSFSDIELHELETSSQTGRKVIVDLGSTELNTKLASLQVLLFDKHPIQVNLAKKTA